MVSWQISNQFHALNEIWERSRASFGNLQNLLAVQLNAKETSKSTGTDKTYKQSKTVSFQRQKLTPFYFILVFFFK